MYRRPGAAELPVKNTFVHFDDPSAGGMGAARGRRSLRRCRTDPEEQVPWELPRVDPRAAAGVDEGAAVPDDMYSELTHQHTPADPAPLGARSSLPKLEALPETPSCSGDDSTDISIYGDDSTDISTPEHSPRSWAPSTVSTSPDTSSTPLPAPCPYSPGASFQGSLAQERPRGAFMSPHPAMVPPTVPVFATPFVPAPDFFEGGFSFTFALRLADDCGLGLDVAAMRLGSPCLLVQQVLNHGGIYAWNRQCLENMSAPMRALRRGDAIVRVNQKTDCEGMLEECREKMLLKMTVVRMSPACYPGVYDSVAGYWPWAGPGDASIGPEVALPALHGCVMGEGERLHASKLPVAI